MPDLRLAGCTSRPLAGYLKAIGVLRVVAEQADPQAAGRWRDGVFEVRSALSEDGLVDFLLQRYEPAPVVSPWNGGSGFHANDRKRAIERLESSQEPRFAAYRETIAAARQALARTGLDGKPDAATKPRLVRDLRRTLPDAALDWLDAAVVIVGDETDYPPLLGSGGNDGRYEFSNNYAHAIIEMLVDAQPVGAISALRAAVLGSDTDLQAGLSLGHFTRDTSPTNSPAGEADSLGNPWELILAVEGALLLVAGAARRHGTTTQRTLTAPFTAYPTAAGYGSAVPGETGRAELWLPLWPGWTAKRELIALARESRAQVRTAGATPVRAARDGLDFVRAAGELGVARGIGAFERYVILERAGQSSLAVPVGRVSVRERSRTAVLRELDPWLNRILGRAGDDGCPRAVRLAIRRAERAAFDLAVRDNSESCTSLLVALGELEGQLARSATWATEKGILPVHGLTARTWIPAADDGSAEFIVAAGLASLRGKARAAPALRDYLHGTALNANNGRIRRAFDERRAHAVIGNSPTAVLAQVHLRRHRDAARHAADRDRDSQLPFEDGTWVNLAAARLFAAGHLDNERIIRLAQGLSLLDHKTGAREATGREPRTELPAAPVPAFDVLALAWAPQQSESGSDPGADQSASGSTKPLQAALGARRGGAAALAIGAIEPVVRDACLRLRMAGRPPLVRADDLLCGTPGGDHLSAALLLRLGPGAVAALTRQLTVWPDDNLTAQRTTTEG